MLELTAVILTADPSDPDVAKVAQVVREVGLSPFVVSPVGVLRPGEERALEDCAVVVHMTRGHASCQYAWGFAWGRSLMVLGYDYVPPAPCTIDRNVPATTAVVVGPDELRDVLRALSPLYGGDSIPDNIAEIIGAVEALYKYTPYVSVESASAGAAGVPS